MKTDEDIIEDVQDYIFSTELAEEVTGVIKGGKRPKGSTKEDILISVLANENGQTQQCTVNVNIYVKDLPASRDTERNKERLKELGRMSGKIFTVFRGKDYRARLLSQRMTDVGEDEHVITNKIEYKQKNE